MAQSLEPFEGIGGIAVCVQDGCGLVHMMINPIASRMPTNPNPSVNQRIAASASERFFRLFGDNVLLGHCYPAFQANEALCGATNGTTIQT